MERNDDKSVIDVDDDKSVIDDDDHESVDVAGDNDDEKEHLPVYSQRELIVSTIRRSQFVVISGSTGSGKSTQIPQYILESIVGPDSLVAVSQPRRVGAISLARRVAVERKTTVGDDVGYTVRFEDCTSKLTRIRYITDGCLLREIAADPLLKKYGAIVLDEAHERSLQTDILLGLMRQRAHLRPDLRVVITSATLDLVKFSRFLDDCPMLSIPGRCFPVELNHIDTMEHCKFYVDVAVDLAATIHAIKPEGHILVFLTGQEEIERACMMLANKIDSLHEDGVSMPPEVILPMYGALSSSGQSRVFMPAPKGCRKIIFSSNIAETSLTIAAVRYVIDTGLMKQKVFDPGSGIEALTVTKISHVSATQRAGRAGRTAPGTCYRLYSTDDMESFPEETVPEIQRSCLSHTVLLLKELGIADPLTFPFLDRPSVPMIENALRHLFMVGGLDIDGDLTNLGHEMAQLPLEPTLALLLLKAIERGCADEMMTIAAMISAEHIWVSSRGDDSDLAHMRFRSRFGDHITVLFVYEEWMRMGRSSQWCLDHFLSARALQTAHLIRRQLHDALRPVIKPGKKCLDSILECRRIIAQASFHQCAHRVGEGLYRLYRSGHHLGHNRNDPLVYGIHYQSALRLVQPKWVVYGELSAGNMGRPMMRNVTAIDIDWVRDLLPRLNQADVGRLAGRRPPSPSLDQTLPATAAATTTTPISKAAPRSPSPRTKAARERFTARKNQRRS